MHHLTAAGVSLLFGTDDRGLPFVLHWGAALPSGAIADLAASAGTTADSPFGPTIVASGADGWLGTPAFEWHAEGAPPAALELRDTRTTADSAAFTFADPRTGGVVTLHYRLHPGGAVEVSAQLENTGAAVIDVVALRALLPVPDRAREIEDFTGTWAGERRPQRVPLADGTWDRTGRRGRPGFDAPILTTLGTPGFGSRTGEVWSAHLAWSGNGRVLVERLPEGAGAATSMLGAGEQLVPGEVRLAPGERYAAPSTLFAWSDRGTDGASARLHAFARALRAHPDRPRPLTINNWEATYFDHDLDRLLGLVAAAGRIGVERFVLDDGWFLGRRDDTAGLGDWSVDPTVWPRGLTPLADAVRAAGMEFGLWFEPEMVNPDSAMARSHPEWILSDPAGAGRLRRNQLVLNLGDPACWDAVFAAMDRVIGDAGVAYVKWDHNRELHEAVDRTTLRPGVARQTRAVYRLMDALQEAHPGLEIESCSSGGGRVDLGMAQHTQRVWASDTIDPIERHMIQRGTERILPLELIGTHVGASPAHTTGRVTSLSFRLATALFGHSGIEWDLAELDEAGFAALTAWAALYREQRGLLHSGEVVHADAVPDGAALFGVVDPTREHGLFQWAQLVTGRLSSSPRTPVPGLDPDRRYRVRFREEIGRAHRRSVRDPEWCRTLGGAETVSLSGAVLTGPGVPLPALQPAEALVIEFSAEASA